MSRYSSLDNRTNTFLPEQYWAGHDLCFFIHDVMARLLASGERASIYHVKFDVKDEKEVKALENSGDVFEWMNRYRRFEERAAVMVVTVFPAVLSDMLHCMYEALETSRKAKLGISFMLLRKPLQENLYLLEAVIANRADFAQKLTDDPVKLWSQGVGGREAHTKNIAAVLKAIGDDGRFDAEYLAQLRYDKSAPDGFDGICNKAMHLFTSHRAIATDKMDINFIFSDWHSKKTQWAYIYSRLPYLLAYAYEIVEFVCAGISRTTPDYLNEIKRRMSAHVVLWSETIDDDYRDERLERFIAKSSKWLDAHCIAAGYRVPNEADLVRMILTGAFPGETRWQLWRRMRTFEVAAEESGTTELSKLSRILRIFRLR